MFHRTSSALAALLVMTALAATPDTAWSQAPAARSLYDQQVRYQTEIQYHIRNFVDQVETEIRAGDCQYVVSTLRRLSFYLEKGFVTHYDWETRRSFGARGPGLTDVQEEEVIRYAKARYERLIRIVKVHCPQTIAAIVSGDPCLPGAPTTGAGSTTAVARYSADDEREHEAWVRRLGRDLRGQDAYAQAGQVLIETRFIECTRVSPSIGVNQIWVPTVSAGTQFDPGLGREVPIARSDRTLTGESAGMFVKIPLPQSVPILGQSLIINGSVGWFEGLSRGEVPVGATGVAFTYLFPNPVSGSTGLFAGATGQRVAINTEGRTIDLAVASKREQPLAQAGGSQVTLHTTMGFRYRNFELEHRIVQKSLFFDDLKSRISLDQSSNFYGLQVSAGVHVEPPRAGAGFFGGADLFLVPGVLTTDATATQKSRCGPCGAASPEFNVFLQRDLSTLDFSVIMGASGHLGYRLTPNTQVSLRGLIEHMTDVPVFRVPTTPAEQPIGLDRDSAIVFKLMGALTVDLAILVPPRLVR
jgi:hypothetical protein